MKFAARNIVDLLAVGYSSFSTAVLAQSSVCYGETHNGRLENGVQVIAEPTRFFCEVCVALGRVFAHEPVAETVTAAYKTMAGIFPDTDFVLGEIGWRQGGTFRPHRTHQNGLSVDFMVPLTDGTFLPTTAATRFGYDLEFDSRGKGSAGEIDFPAIDAHLNALGAEAKARGGRIRRIFFAPDLSSRLTEESKSTFNFNTREAWVRHDDHYHVDFDFPCTALKDG